ncbi:hypothetical protein QNI19_08095 [Cytophagaceae bacterium DM2B3-1]|uniref:DUF4595 domain-containing protein n=1 Tax=Xanthocytophaga flava TaxID=3048013 RepID=A0ABT7CGN3_9BACT|nr:hypothetical protein [Xanthocytophaga flavus]MDJ1471126.1 hypothetical protein [Xanthocytophaga flavus]MDJ1492888.1 hypothetical protein [Xanthocytophaga flavus]
MIKHLIPCLFAGLLVVTSCKSDSDEAPTPEPEKTCKLVSIKSVVDGNSDTLISTNTYDANGWLITNEGKSKGNLQYRVTYTYNPEGFVTERRDTSSGYSSSVTRYEYIQGKLSKSTGNHTSIYNDEKYETTYNTDGTLARIIRNWTSPNGDGTFHNTMDTAWYNYTNGRLTEIRYMSSNYNIIQVNKVETDARGLITKVAHTDTNAAKYIYIYDTQGQLIRDEIYFGGLLYEYQTYEYDDKEIIDKFTDYTPKGQAVTEPTYGLKIHNVLRRERYQVENQTNKQIALHRFTYEYDEKGLPKKSTRYTKLGGDEANTVVTYTFDCQ